MTSEKKIKDKTYRIDPMLAKDALRLKAKLLKIIGGGVERLPEILAGAGSGKSAELKNASNAAAIAAFSDIFVKGDPDEMVEIVGEIISNAKVHRPSSDWEPVQFDDYSSNDLTEVFEVVVFVLTSVFGSFFDGLLANGKLRKVTKSFQETKSGE